jgi:hypothetical protein
MMKLSNVLILIGVAIFTSGCRDQTKPIQIQKENMSLTLPGYLSEDELSEDAIVEYANRFRNFYLVVIPLSNELSEDSAWRQSSSRITNSLMDFKIDTTRDQENNKLSKITGHFKDEKDPIYYFQKLLVKGQRTLVLTIWIRGEQRFQKYRDDIEGITNSFNLQK